MKRFGYLIGDITTRENIELAIKDTIKNRRKKRNMKSQIDWYKDHKEDFIKDVINIITTGEWNFGNYNKFLRYEHNKMREIYWSPKFINSVIQHAIGNVIRPILEGCLITDTYSGIVDRGFTRGIERLASFHFAV